MSNRRKLKRRTVLKASGATAVFGTFGGLPGTTSALPSGGEEIGTRTVVDIGLTYRNTPDAPVSHTDDVADYAVGQANAELVVNERRASDVRQVVRENDLIAKGDSFFGTPGSAFGNSVTGLPAGPTHELSLAEAHSLPDVKVESASDGRAEVTAAGEVRLVDPGVKERLTLPEVDVSIRPPSDELTEVEDPRRGTTQMVRKQGAIETVTVEPVVEAVNFGQVTIRAVNGVSDR